MSNPDQFQDSPPAKQGMSGTLKVVLILVGLGGVSLLVCCGGMAFFGMRAAKAIQEGTTEEPAKVKAATADIVDIDIPADFEPKMAMNVIFMKYVLYQNKSQGMLMLSEFNSALGSDVSKQRDEMAKAMKQQSNTKMPSGTQKTETREFTIRGEKASFQFTTATTEKQKKPADKPAEQGEAKPDDSETETDDTEADEGGEGFHQVVGSFKGKGGTVMLFLMINGKDYDEAAIVKMIESIH